MRDDLELDLCNLLPAKQGTDPLFSMALDAVVGDLGLTDKPKRILFVDDCHRARPLLKSLGNIRQVQVEVCLCAEVCDKSAQSVPDMIILVVVPWRDHEPQAMDVLRSNPVTAGVPVFIFTEGTFETRDWSGCRISVLSDAHRDRRLVESALGSEAC